MEKCYVKVGEHVMVRLPFSEVMMHMGIGGHTFEVEVKEHSAQLWKDGREFSIPVCHGEAGIYTRTDGNHFYFKW